MAYEYTATDRMLEPHRYMYTPYLGASFLTEFFRDRRSFVPVAERPLPAAIPDAVRECIALAAGERTGGEGSDTPARTRDLLVDCAEALLAGASPCERLMEFVRRFEVTRKLHDRYGHELRPEPGAESGDLRLYAWLSVCCGLAYRSFGKIQLLNCQLKLNDLLSSCRARFTAGEGELPRLCAIAVALEEEAVRGVMKEAGVENDPA